MTTTIGWFPHQHRVLQASDLVALVDAKLALGDGAVALMAASVAVAASDATPELIAEARALVLDDARPSRRERRLEALSLAGGALTPVARH